MYSLNDITNGGGTLKTLENGYRTRKISTYEMPVVKVEIPEPSCSTVRHQTISLPQESLYDARSLGEINTEQDVLKIQISNVQGATSDKNIDRNEMPTNQKENQVNNISNHQMQSNFHIATQEKSPFEERFPGRQLCKIIQEKRNALETGVRSPVNQSSFHNGKPLSETELQKELQFNSDECEIVPPYNFINQPDISQMSTQYPSQAYQTNVTMSAYQGETRGTLSSYRNDTPQSISFHQISTNMAAPSVHTTSQGTVPLYHMQKTPTSQTGNITNIAPPSVHVNSHATAPLYRMEKTPTSQTGNSTNMSPPSLPGNSHATAPLYRMEKTPTSQTGNITNMATPSVHVNSHATAPLYRMEKTPTSQTGNSTNMAPPSVPVNSHDTVPLYHMEERSPSQTGDGEKNASFKADYHAGMSKYNGDYSFHDFQQGMPYWQEETHDTVPNLQMGAQGCNCCCHGRNESSPRYPDFEPKNQRPSVIMVPVSWNSSDSVISHLPLKVNTSAYKLHSERHWPNGEGVAEKMQYSVDSDSSDDDDEYGKEKYFRKNIDGTTARFKLTKEEWARIPINTFPSGGRLLSGDWTRIFLSKVKESNPWCSLRFKNNHVRSENSRKIHSAVFFRGGAECKRPECNVKVRFVIRKEKGKHVDVTYVGDVCHNSQPGGSDATSNKKRLNRVRRAYST